jgi:hypothetical protein
MAWVNHFRAPRSWNGLRVEILDDYKKGSQETYYWIRGLEGQQLNVERWMNSLWLTKTPPAGRESSLKLGWQVEPEEHYRIECTPGDTYPYQVLDNAGVILLAPRADFMVKQWIHETYGWSLSSAEALVNTAKREGAVSFDPQPPQPHESSLKLGWRVVSEAYTVRYDKIHRRYRVLDPEGKLLYKNHSAVAVSIWMAVMYGWSEAMALRVVDNARKEGVCEFVVNLNRESSLKLGWRTAVENKEELKTGDRVVLLEPYKRARYFDAGELREFPAGSTGVVASTEPQADFRVKIRFDNPLFATPVIFREHIGIPIGSAYTDGWMIDPTLFAKLPDGEPMQETASLQLTSWQTDVPIASYWNSTGPSSEYDEELFRKLIPISGPAPTSYGELLREITRIYYDRFNNGFGNGPHTTEMIEVFKSEIEQYLADPEDYTTFMLHFHNLNKGMGMVGPAAPRGEGWVGDRSMENMLHAIITVVWNWYNSPEGKAVMAEAPVTNE